MNVSHVAVTGGNGKIGEYLIDHLNQHGYHTVNIARGKQRETVSDQYLSTDLLDAGQVYGSLAKGDVDAVIHMGTIPRPQLHAQHLVYESNAMSTVHILEAAEALGLESVCIASSINAMGAEHQRRPADVRYVPIDESHPRTPDDIYGIAKHAMEVTADGFARRPDSSLTIASLRYPWVVTRDEQREFLVNRDRSLKAVKTSHPATGRDVMFAYLDIDDGAAIARMCIEAEYTGHEVFWAVAGDTTVDAPTTEVLDEYFPQADCTADFSGTQTLFSLTKANEMLGWEPTRSWRDLVA